MASGSFKDTWLIWLLGVVAVVFTVMAFSKEKAKEAVVPAPVSMAAPAAVKSVTVPTGTIKPSHTDAAMKDIAATKPKEGIVEPLKVIPSREVFAVQVYSFKDKNRADTQLQVLKQKGFTAYIMVSDLGARGIWYRVRVGTYGNEEDARRVLEVIRQDFKSGIVVTE
ncbi:MAG: SPOR domain-containing protein [Candidatus Omnitrophica bacterium]|nr:SPOR domain-containing protein [Candidatus Omnitrophota bacterium]